MQSLLTWIESSLLGEAVRGAGVWTYGIINLMHIIGVATLFGSILILDLRLLGWRRGVSLVTVAGFTVPIAATGFCLAVLSGLCLLATNGSEYIGNPFLLIKFAVIGLALLNILTLGRTAAWKRRGAPEQDERDHRILALFGGVSLLSWLTVVACGRMIGYW